MKRLLVGAAVLVAGVVGADISAVSCISGSRGATAFAQEAGQSPATGSGASTNGFGNGGAALGSGGGQASGEGAGGSSQSQSSGASGAAKAAGSPDAAGKVGVSPSDAQAGADAKPDDAATSGDAKDASAAKTAAPEAQAAATTSVATTNSEELQAIPQRATLPKASGNGNLDYSVAIDVPAFHGIEPKIALSYNSSRKTKISGLYQGWLGYAWGLGGLDVIERASPGYGMPFFKSSDIYLLDGQAMIACVAGMVSPSCSTGGTHATENESYRRIALNATTNEWTVTDTDGTASTFRSVAAIAGLTPAAGTPAYDLAVSYRWLLTSVTDTNGNTVNYSYTCPASPVCYPDAVSYNGTVINFYYETRPDPIWMGNGRDISETDRRIKTISIKVGGAQRGAYKITYDQAPFSGTSRLTQVTRYGTDATVSADGTIGGGTSKVVAQMAYQNADGAYSTINTPLFGLIPPFTPGYPTSFPNQAGDLNFDGRDEVFGDFTPTATPDSSRKGVIKFSADGTPAEAKTVTVPKSAIVSIRNVGRVIASKNTMDFLDAGLIWPWIVMTDPQLNLTMAYCTPSPPPAYAGMCSGSALFPSAVADLDGDGVDTVFSAGYGYMSASDFQGDGKQIPWLRGTGDADRYVLKSGQKFNIACVSDSVTTAPTCLTGDVNGDGATDIVSFRSNNDTADIYLSTGSGFKHYSVAGIAGDSGMLRDFDNDGKADMVTANVTNIRPTMNLGAIRVYSFSASSSGYSATQFTLPAPITAGTVVGDFNGDGLPDFTDYNHMFISDAGSGNPNLLKQIVTETGGTVAVEYSPSSRWTNDYMPQLVHAVTKLSVGDGRGQNAVSSYAYSGGKYDPVARKFLGFASIVETRPLANGETAAPTVTTTYRQDLASYGLPSLTVWKDGAGTVRKQVAETYAVNAATRPYTVQNTATDTTLSENVSLSTRVERGFDAYNNIVSLKDYGRTDAGGDETWTERFFSPNTSAYIVSAPITERVHAGLTAGDPYVGYRHNFYDGNTTDLGTPPTRGNLTWVRTFTDPGLTKTVNQYFAYDGYGNKISDTNGLGHRTEWDYDATYHLYPVTERAPRYFATGGQSADTRFVSSATFNAVCGLPATRTDPNGIVKTFTYDAFCRPYQVSQNVLGAYTRTRFENEGNPATQALVKYTPLPNGASGGASEDFTRSYYDGLGRVYRVETPGETSAGPTRIADTDYDQRSNVLRTAFPRFVGETAQWTTNSYDWADRLVKTVNPDASQRTYLNALAPASTPNPRLNAVIVTDELGHQTKTTWTTHGDISSIVRDLGGLGLTETRGYDVLGKLTGITDPGGSIWSYSYDMTGNRLSASDPDLGAWSYVYDAANRLVGQTDARGTVTTLAYDQMDRLTLKTAAAAGGGAVTLTQNTYDQAAAGYYNIGQLTRSENAAAVQLYNYDGIGKVARQDAIIGGITHVTFNVHDGSGQNVYVQYFPVQLDFGSNANRLQYTAGNKLYAAPGFITSTLYEADGQTREITYANGVKTTFTYSPTRRWVTRVTTSKGATVLLDDQYARDTLGRITGTTGSTASDSWIYGYDNADRLTSSDNLGDNTLDESFVYAANDNMVSRSRVAGAYTYPAATAPRPHAPTSVGANAMAYDANGNLTSDGSRTLAWGEANRLKTVTLASNTVNLSYGPDGARAKKASSFATTLYPDASVEIDPATPGAEVYTRYPHPDIKVTGTTAFFLHRDHLASVRMVTDSSGAIAEATSYATYGERLNSGFQTQKSYIGERFDPETGLLYLNARYMDPVLGRFIPADPGEAKERDP